MSLILRLFFCIFFVFFTLNVTIYFKVRFCYQKYRCASASLPVQSCIIFALCTNFFDYIVSYCLNTFLLKLHNYNAISPQKLNLCIIPIQCFLRTNWHIWQFYMPSFNSPYKTTHFPNLQSPPLHTKYVPTHITSPPTT